MVQQHSVVMSTRRYPRGLRFFECRDCNYAFMAEVYANDVPDLKTRVPVNAGDRQAAHSLFASPSIKLTFTVGAAADGAPGAPSANC